MLLVQQQLPVSLHCAQVAKILAFLRAAQMAGEDDLCSRWPQGRAQQAGMAGVISPCSFLFQMTQRAAGGGGMQKAPLEAAPNQAAVLPSHRSFSSRNHTMGCLQSAACKKQLLAGSFVRPLVIKLEASSDI